MFFVTDVLKSTEIGNVDTHLWGTTLPTLADAESFAKRKAATSKGAPEYDIWQRISSTATAVPTDAEVLVVQY